MRIINTETTVSVLICDKSTRGAPRAGTFFDDVPFKLSWIHLSMIALARGLARYGARSIGRVSWGKGNVASALIGATTKL